MNRKKLYLLVSAMMVAMVAAWAMLSSVGIAKINSDSKLKVKLKKTDVVDLEYVAYNNWNYVMRNQGSYFYDSPDQDRNGNNAGGEFPRGSRETLIYAAGLYIGTLKNGVPVVSETEFSTEFRPGRITNSGVAFTELTAENYADQANQVYLIDRSGSGDDWNNWPADAPKDQFDNPGIIADAQTWVVFNDLDTELSQEGVSISPSPGIGVQVVLESFAFNAGPLSDVVYCKFTIINKTNVDYEDSYLGMWMDADIDADNSTNDIVGIDTAKGLGFVYNADESDLHAAAGFDFLQGPVVKTNDVSPNLVTKFSTNTKVLVYSQTLKRYVPTNLPSDEIWLGATSFNTYANGTDPRDNSQRYNLLAGRFANGTPKTGQGASDYYAFRGNPITQQGSPDVATSANQADQRILHGVGPFTIKAGSSQEIWVGVIGALGADRLNAVSNMFNTDDLAQATFEAGLIAPVPPDVPRISVSSLEGKVSITWQNNAEFSEDVAGEILNIDEGHGYFVGDDNSMDLDHDGVIDGFTSYLKNDFQGYRVYKSRTGLPGSFTLLAQYDKIDAFQTVQNRSINTAGLLITEPVQVGTNTGLRYHYIDDDVIDGQIYYYSVTAYDAQPYISGPGNFAMVDLNGNPITKTLITAEAATVLLRDRTLPAFPDSLIQLDSADFVTANLNVLTNFETAVYKPDGNAATLIGDTLYLTRDTNTVTTQSPDLVTHAYVCSLARYHTENFDKDEVQQALTSLTIGSSFKWQRPLNVNSIPIGAPGSIFATANYTWTILAVEDLSEFIPKPSGLPISLETSPTANVVAVMPAKAISSIEYDAETDSGFAHRTGGTSDGFVELEIVDPEKVISGTYTVEFFEMPASVNGKVITDLNGHIGPGALAYRVVHSALGERPFSTRTDDINTFLDGNSNGDFDVDVNGNPINGDEKYNDVYFNTVQADPNTPAQEEFGVVDGILIKMYGPPLFGISSRYTVGPQYTAKGITSTSASGRWFTGVNAGVELLGGGVGLGYNFLGSAIEPAKLRTCEIRFSRDSTKWQYAYGHAGAFGNQNEFFKVPFSVWEVDETDGSATPRQVNVLVRDGATLNANGWFLDNTIGGNASGPHARNYTHIQFTDYDSTAGSLNSKSVDIVETIWSLWTMPRTQSGLEGADGFAWNDLLKAAILPSSDGGATVTPTERAGIYSQIPDEGTLKLVAPHINTDADKWTFTTTANSQVSSATQKKSLKDIRVVPNPYYGRSSYQASLFDKVVKFTNLPGNCTIKIFTVSGDLVSTINHNATSNNDRINSNPLSQTADAQAKETSIERWDLRNPGGKFVASGMYVALVEAPGVGKTIVKFAVIQEEIQINGPDNR